MWISVDEEKYNNNAAEASPRALTLIKFYVCRREHNVMHDRVGYGSLLVAIVTRV